MLTFTPARTPLTFRASFEISGLAVTVGLATAATFALATFTNTSLAVQMLAHHG